MLVVTLGDLLLDVIVRLDEPLAAGADANAATRTAAGGQAANVAAWVAALGGDARCVARRGDDAAGAWVDAELTGRGVELAGPVDGRTGVVVSLVAPGGERTLASDRGTATLLEPADLDPAWFACDCLHISGYALLASPIDKAAARAVELARAYGARISVDLSAWTRIRAYAHFQEQLEDLAPDIVFGNAEEWDELPAFQAGTRIVKHGAEGFDVVRDGEAVRCQAPDVAVVDTTGAGDALAAGFLVGGAEVGAQAAARCVAQVGAMP
ncbi:MAG: carbohydrate kinase family protein [Gaiellaceae bacterium]|jgi:ribokinase